MSFMTRTPSPSGSLAGWPSWGRQPTPPPPMGPEGEPYLTPTNDSTNAMCTEFGIAAKLISLNIAGASSHPADVPQGQTQPQPLTQLFRPHLHCLLGSCCPRGLTRSPIMPIYASLLTLPCLIHASLHWGSQALYQVTVTQSIHATRCKQHRHESQCVFGCCSTNMSIQDADCLGRCFEAQPHDPVAALHKYTEERIPQTTKEVQSMRSAAQYNGAACLPLSPP